MNNIKEDITTGAYQTVYSNTALEIYNHVVHPHTIILDIGQQIRVTIGRQIAVNETM